MPEMPSQETSPGFDYCFWSKLLVAIVLFPLVAYIAQWFFASLVLKMIAVAVCLGGLIRAAIWLDRVPCLTAKIPPLLGKGAKTPKG